MDLFNIHNKVERDMKDLSKKTAFYKKCGQVSCLKSKNKDTFHDMTSTLFYKTASLM